VLCARERGAHCAQSNRQYVREASEAVQHVHGASPSVYCCLIRGLSRIWSVQDTEGESERSPGELKDEADRLATAYRITA
jgi:hypothetical protein